MWNEFTNASSAVFLMTGGNVLRTAVLFVNPASFEESKPYRAEGFVLPKSAKPEAM